MKVSVLASGSKGNCTLIQEEDTAFIIDMGISMRRLKNELALHRLHIEDLSGVFITHEHSDHIKGLTTLTKYHRIPILTRSKTFQRMGKILQLTDPQFINIENKEQIKMGNIKVENFSIAHDTVDPCAYFVQGAKHNVTVVTDLGRVGEDLADYLSSSHGIVLESNYDADMLRFGEYLLALKRRIAGARGHLSNGDAAGLLAKLDRVPEQIILAHLSQENNAPGVALQTVKGQMENAGINLNNHRLQVAEEKQATTFVVEG